MGMDINIYTKELSVELLPKIRERFADFDMNIEFHPEFKFDEKEDSGFLPIKLRMKKGNSKKYDVFDSDIMTGFELIFSDFKYQVELDNLQTQNLSTKSKSFFSKLFNNKKDLIQSGIFVADEELDKYLKFCTKEIILSWKSWNVSELRISLFFASILAELTEGVIYDPQEGRYLSASKALETFPAEIIDYENSISESDFNLDKFEEWI